MTAAVQEARDAHMAWQAKLETARRERAKLAELELQQRNSEEERHSLRAQEDRDAAIRLIDGEDAAPKKPRRASKLARLDDDAAAVAAAIQIQKRRVADAELEAGKPYAPFVGSVLELMADVQGDALTEARSALSNLAPIFARLVAADQIRAATIGERFALPKGAEAPFSGLTTVRTFSKAIPDRLRPPELAELSLFGAAHLISSPIITEIKGA